LAKEKRINYEVKGTKKKKKFVVPEKAVNVEVSSTPRTYKSKGGKSVYGVKVRYLSSRKKDATKRTKIVPVPKGTKNVKLA